MGTKRSAMKKKLFLEGISEDAKEEIYMLYDIGIGIEELEYLIKVKFEENINSKPP